MKEIDFGTYSSVFELLPSGSYLHGLIVFLTVVTFLPSWLSLVIISVATSFSVPETFFTAGIFENAKVRMQLYK